MANRVGSGFVEINTKLDDKSVDKSRAALAELSKNRTAEFFANLDERNARVTEARLAGIARLRDAGIRPTIDIPSEKGVQARLAALGRGITAQVKVGLERASAAATEARLALMGKDRKVEIKTDVDKSALSRVEGLFGAHGRRSGDSFGKNLSDAGTAILSLMPSRLEGIFTKTGPLIGGGLMAGMAGAIAIALPAIGAMISGALFAAVGSGGLVAGFLAVKDDPRIQGAIQNLKQQFMGIFDSGTKDFIVRQFAPAFNTLSTALRGNAPFIRQIVEAGATFAGPIANGIKMFADGVMKPLADLMKSNFMKDIMNILGHGLGTIGQSIGKIFDSFLKDPAAMEGAKKGLENLIGLFRWGIDQSGVFLKKMSEFWNQLNTKGADGKSTIDHVSAAFTAFGHAVQTVWNILSPFVKSFMKTLADEFKIVGDLIQGHWGAAWNHMRDMFFHWVQYILALANAVWRTLVAIFGNLVVSIGSALDHLGQIFQSWYSQAINAITGFVHNSIALFQGWGANLANWWNTFWAWTIGRVIGWAQQTIQMFIAWGQNVMNWWQNVRAWFAQAWDWLWAHTVSAVVNWWNQTLQLFSGWGQNIMNWWNNVRNWFAQAWDWLWAHTAAIVVNWAQGLLNTFGQWGNNIRNWWQNTLNWLHDFWNGTWNGIRQFFMAIWDAIWNWARDRINQAHDMIAGALNKIAALWNSIWTGIKKFFSDIWNDIVKGITDSFEKVKGVLNKGADVVNKVMDAVGIPFKIPHFAQGGLVEGFAEGGAIRGRGTGVSDDILARVSNGEFIITAEKYRQHRQLVNSIHDGTIDEPDRYGRLLRKYAGGGHVKIVWRGANGDNEGLMQQHMNHVHVAMAVAPSHDPQKNPAIVAAMVPSGAPLNPVSGYRPGSTGSGGGLDHHSEGRATDFGGFNQDKLAMFAASVPGVIELIHRSAKGDYGIFGSGGSALHPWLAEGWASFLKKHLAPAEEQMHAGLSFEQSIEAAAAHGFYPGAASATPAAVASIPGLTNLRADYRVGLPANVMAGGFRSQDAQGTKAMNVVIKKKVDEAIAAAAAAAASASSGGGGGAAQWTGVATKALQMLGLPGSWLGPLLTLIGRESGGNPNAINRSDSNARAGIPSQGLMQTIPPTFMAYHMPGYNNILDPLSNILAGLRYIQATYGSIFRVQQAVGSTPRGYDNGGPVPPGWAGINTSGQTEMMLNRSQGLALERRIRGDGECHKLDLTVNLDGHPFRKMIDVALDDEHKATVDALTRGSGRNM